MVKFRAHTDPELANEPVLKVEARKLGPNLVEIFDEDQMPWLFEKRSPKDPFFKTVEFIQTCVSDQRGVGKPICFQFYAPIDESKSYLSEEDNLCYLTADQDYVGYSLLEQGRTREFCELQCLRICDYIQKLRHFEIL